MEYAFLSRLSAAQAPNLARRAAQNKPGQIKQATEALRAGICPAAAAGPTFGGSEDRRLRKEKGEPRGGNNHWFFPLVNGGQMSAAECAHGPRFPSGFLE